MTRRRVVVATSDPVAARMAGPAIRAWHVAEVLAEENEVILVSTVECARNHPRFSTERVGELDLRQLEEWMDVLIVQGGLLHEYAFLAESEKVIVADLYDPFQLENLEQTRSMDRAQGDALISHLTGVFNELLHRGDYFLCANDRQRDFWLGGLAALGRVNPWTYSEDENLDSLIAVAPFGVPTSPPQQASHGLRETVAGIGANDKVVLWAGGIYNWFDPGSLVMAIDDVRRRVPGIRLFFLGMGHPNPHIPTMRVATEVRALADRLELTGRYVFFNDSWIDYDRRGDFLLDADVGVSTHFDTVETAFSSRTRVLDYLWAGLPIVVTEGDGFAELVRIKGLGEVVPSSDPGRIADALCSVLSSPPSRDLIRAAAEPLRWPTVLEPLVQFCRAPRRAPDLVGRRAALSFAPLDPAGPAVKRAVQRFRVDGLAGVARSIGRRARSRRPPPSPR